MAAENIFRTLGLSSAKRSISMLLFSWFLNVIWLAVNYFWHFASVEVLLAMPLLLLIYAAIALVAYIYWGVRQVREQGVPYAGVMVGVIVAVTLLYLNYNLLQYVLVALRF
ncbi:hypothetical protein ACFSKU_09095 [Pontibacter silvestris]|uniref:Uncharacterized protein n=1 Tax=Pontibacter silvestris TaxID=2305183 RepID=A0ABW4WWD9_9BACT|nr:hypothetical protein [Pontibacter silvestris]MCC9137677.1 hypothetical protein [Pontibacter silvestris]